MTTQDSDKLRTPPAFYRSRVGAFNVIALHDGTVSRERAPGFIRNAPPEDVEEAFAQLGIAPGQLTLTFSTLAVETPVQLALIDTGFGENGGPTTGHLKDNLAAAGYSPADVGTVLVSHFHTDHISGLVTKDDKPAFPNATIMVARPEWDYWMNDATMEAAAAGLQPTFKLCRRVFGSLKERIQVFDWGDTVMPGITAMRAAGHTPGQTAFDIRSGSERLLYVADITNNPLVFARRPGWQPAFDIDPDEAVRTRRKILSEAADQKTRLFFFHAPFPGLGFVAREGEGFAYIPQIWSREA